MTDVQNGLEPIVCSGALSEEDKAELRKPLGVIKVLEDASTREDEVSKPTVPASSTIPCKESYSAGFKFALETHKCDCEGLVEACAAFIANVREEYKMAVDEKFMCKYINAIEESLQKHKGGE